jgi:hypothetical protein
MILKFFLKNNDIILDSNKAEIIDITKDFRTRLLDKDHMVSDKFKFKDGIYFIKKEFFIKMAKLQNKSTIEALLINYYNNKIIIVGDKKIVFFDGYPVNLTDYDESIDENKGLEIAKTTYTNY